MNAKEFVELIKKEKEEIVNRYVTPLENIQIKDTDLIKRIKIKKSRPDDFVHRGGSFYVRYNLCSRGARVCSLCRRIWDVWRG